MIKLKRLYEAIEGRTPGPWEVRSPEHGTMYVPYITDANGGLLASTSHYGKMLEDATFIATMGTCADEILAVLRAAGKLVINYEQGVNRGAYRHLANGDVAISGEHWNALNNAYDALVAKSGQGDTK